MVFGDLQVAAARSELVRMLRASGYRTGKRGDGKTVFSPEDPWRPTVVVYDDGFVRLKRSPVRFEPPGQTSSSSRLRYLWCLPPLTPMCVRVGGQLVSKKKLDPQKAAILLGGKDEISQWREALIARAMATRVGSELPNRLDELWITGRPLEGGGPNLEHWADRRRVMLEYWSSRTCTPEGDAIAEVVATFMEYEVQGSSNPVTRDEESAANTAQQCSRELALPHPTTP